MKKISFLILFTLFSLIQIYAQNDKLLFATEIPEPTFESPNHQWRLNQIEYYKDCTICRFVVKATKGGVYLRLLPDCYILDEEGNRYDIIESSLTSKIPGHKFSVSGEPLAFYMKFPPIKDGISKMSLILPELKVFENILVGNGTSKKYTFEPAVKSTRANIYISEIEITDTKTTVKFIYDNTKSSLPGYWEWASISPKSILKCGGTEYNLLPGNDKSFTFNKRTRISFICEFEPIPKNTKTIDFIETPTSSFNIYGVELTSNKTFH